MYPYNKSLVKNAQELRKNMTREEKRLWYDLLKKLPITVKRQYNIENFIVDFYIASKKVVIEVDGAQHRAPEHEKADETRDKSLSEWGITVIRYSNEDINKHFNRVAEHLLEKLGISACDLK